jgi:GNAT superfamily N-acetyltransferase
MQKHNIESDHMFADAFRGDTARIEILTALGWEPESEVPYVLNRTEINSVDVPTLQKGYSFRSVSGIADAAALAEVHNAAFGPIWTPELYQQIMEAPGYEPERELVIQASDGSFAAFSIIWFDHLNRTGLFEPVGTHKDCQRRGFGRAIVLYGMQQMAAAGMEFATVAHFGNNEAARGLYQACGFKPWHLLDGYKKHL